MKTINFLIWCILFPSLMLGIPVGALCLAYHKEAVKVEVKATEVYFVDRWYRILSESDTTYEIKNGLNVSKKYKVR